MTKTTSLHSKCRFLASAGGGSGKLVFEDQNAKTPDAVVVKAIARASIWFEQLTTCKARSMAEIAVRENITDNYVSNLIHLAWLVARSGRPGLGG